MLYPHGRYSFFEFLIKFCSVPKKRRRQIKMQVNEKLCKLCSAREIESEALVLLHCPLYNDKR